MTDEALLRRILRLERDLERMRAIEIAPGINVGTAFPASASDGAFFYRTDVDELFRYDSGRTAWLGDLHVYAFAASGTVAASTYLNLAGGVTATSSIAYRIPYTARVVGASQRVDTGASGTFDILDTGSAIATISHAGAGSGDLTLNAALTLGGRLAVRNTAASSSVANPVVTVFVRRVLT